MTIAKPLSLLLLGACLIGASTDASAEDLNSDVVYGAGLRLRQVWVPKSILELGVAHAPGGVFKTGVGLDAVRKKGNTEIVFGFEYESLSPPNGFYVEKGHTATEFGFTDFVEFDGFSWLTLDFSILRHKRLKEKLYLRYGGGAGIGFLLGDILKTDSQCSSENTESCQRITTGGGEIDDPADVPPVFFVLNAYGGLQYRIKENIHLNVEAGFRTVMFFGLSGHYFF